LIELFEMGHSRGKM